MLTKISKTMFLKGLNCPRVFYLNDLKSNYTNQIDDIYRLEDKYKTLSNMHNEILETEDDFDFESAFKEKIDPQMELLLPYFNQIESHTAQYAEHIFKRKVIHSYETSQQKFFTTKIDNYEFYCFLDGYQELDDVNNIIETKATTSSKYISLNYEENGQFYTIFETNEFGILQTRQSLGLPVNEKYHKKIKDKFKRGTKEGKYIYDLAYQRLVIENNPHNNKINKYYLAVLNSDYIFDGSYLNNEPNYLKDIEEENFLIKLIDVTDITLMMLEELKQDLKTVLYRLNNKAISYESKLLCPAKGPDKCEFHSYCYKDIPSKNSIFTYINRHHGFIDENKKKHTLEDLINNHKFHILDVDYGWLQRPVNQIQYNVVKNHETYINKSKIKEILNKLVYPLYHLDFESFNCPLPRFKFEKPYDQSLFQFNLHIESSAGVVDEIKDSYHYLATDNLDHREAIIKELIRLIKPGGTVIVWNESFEKKRLEELASFYPKYSNALLEIRDKIFDLMSLFNGRKHKLYEDWNIKAPNEILYYHEDQQGSYSIKKVLPTLISNLDYANLEVQNGIMAMVTFAKLPTYSNGEFNEKINALVAYCRQDTYAMVKLLEALRKSV